MCRYSLDLNFSAAMTALQPVLRSANSSSNSRYAGFTLTRIAPILAVANWVSTHS